MKHLKIITLFILIVGLGTSGKAQTMSFWEPFNFQANYLKAINLPAGTSTDSIVVKGASGWFARIAAPVANYVVNTSTVGLTKANLNSAYPNVDIGYRVICPNITLGGAIYVKSTENGTTDVWLTTNATPTL